MMRVARRRATLPAFLAAAFFTPLALAKDAPLWEFGLGAGAIAFQDYRGSDTTHAYPLPVPYIVYNGKFLKADRDGVRGTLFNQDWLEINLSFNLTTPVRNDRERSDGNESDIRSALSSGSGHSVKAARNSACATLMRWARLTSEKPPVSTGSVS